MALVLDLDARQARVAADRDALAADLAGERAVLALLVGDEAALAVAARPQAYLGTAGPTAPELRLAALDRDAAYADLRATRIARRPDLMLSVGERFMPDGMPAGTDLAVGVEVPLWGGRGRAVAAASADLDGADARLAAVERDLAIAREQARASLARAHARAEALDGVALPRAAAAWEASLALFAAGATGQGDAVRALESWIAVGREAVAARRDVALSAATLARLEGP